MMKSAVNEIVYEPTPQVKVIPAAIGIGLTMAIGTFFIGLYNYNGLGGDRPFAPTILFLVMTAVFVRLYLKMKYRYTIGADAITVERLFPKTKTVKQISYSEISRIEQKKFKPKLELYSKDGKVLLVIPDSIQRVRGELPDVKDTSEPKPLGGVWLEHYQLRSEILSRSVGAC